MRKSTSDEEERRLLYVALTRAADELYIAGYQGKRKISETCWYQRVKNGLECVALAEPIFWQGEEAQKLVISNESTKQAGLTQEMQTGKVPLTPLPAWITQKNSPEEPCPPKPLTPSRADVAEENAEALQISPSILHRGKAIHLLLEILPELEDALRQNAALLLLKKHWPAGSTKEHLEAYHQVMWILSHPEFSSVFGAGSQAEVPITALVEDGGITRILAGQIDRLVIAEDGVFFVDYKTNRMIPREPSEVPERYVQQLRGYQLALQAIYPHLPIRAAILWTHGPVLMPMSV
jgi:ATP-dependent helicase/nuclease subunit A